MNKKKTLREFLEVLNRLNKANIDFLDGKQPNIILTGKYDLEIKKVQDLINSFDFESEKDDS